MDYSFKTCQHRHMLKIQVDYHRYALRDRKFLLQGIPLCNRVSKKVSKAQILRGHLGEGATSLQSWLSRQVLRSSGGAVLLAKQGPSTNYPLTPNADFKTNPPFSAQVQQGYNATISQNVRLTVLAMKGLNVKHGPYFLLK
jgi:hypothetical protein